MLVFYMTHKRKAGFWVSRTDILIFTGISTASELAKEKGSMIHLLCDVGVIGSTYSTKDNERWGSSS